MSNASANPRAMMVMNFDTNPTSAAMKRPWRPEHVTSYTVRHLILLICITQIIPDLYFVWIFIFSISIQIVLEFIQMKVHSDKIIISHFLLSHSRKQFILCFIFHEILSFFDRQEFAVIADLLWKIFHRWDDPRLSC